MTEYLECIRKEMPAKVTKYFLNEGIEDGFRPYRDVVTSGLVDLTDLVIVSIDMVDCVPFVRNRRGCTFIKYGDYVVIDEDGTKHVCGADKIWNRYEKNNYR